MSNNTNKPLGENGAYWAQRMRIYEQALSVKNEKIVSEIEAAFTKANKDIERDIEYWYTRLAKNNEISLAAARKLLSANELAEFKWDVDEYLQKARESKLNGNWIKELENASARVHISRLEAIKLNVRNTLETAFGAENSIVTAMAKNAYSNGFYHAAMEVQNVVGVNWDIGAIDDGRIEKIIKKPWTRDARTFSDRIWDKKEQMISELQEELTRGCIYGRPLDETISRIEKFVDPKFKNARYAARRLVITESAYFTTLGHYDELLELGMKEFQVDLPIGKGSCEICRAMNGRVFLMSEFKIGLNAPPFHPNCANGGIIPVADEDFEEALREAHAKDGKPADPQVTLEEWEKEFVKNENSGLTNSSESGTIKEDRPPVLSKDDVIEKAKEFAKFIEYNDARSYMKFRAITNSKLGYDGLPKVVSEEEFNRLSENKTLLYRGIKDGNGKTASEILDEFKYGELWTGNSGGAVFGNGVYFSFDESIAKFYSDNNSAIIKAFLSEDARIVDYREIFQEFLKTGIPSIRGDPKEDYQYIIRDLGQYAAMKGYDAIATNGFNGNEHIVVLNRTKLIVKE